jgi:hypothetical protein
MQKLYLEISYLIKELESVLRQEEFVMARPQGYAITTRTSTGLEPENVVQWFMRSCTVFFVPREMTEFRKGQTHTKFRKDLKVMFFHIKLLGKEMKEPTIYLGCIAHITNKRSTVKKFEQLGWEFSYNSEKVLSKCPVIDYEDIACVFKGKCKREKLFSINNSNDIRKKIIEPMLELYRT